MLGREASLFFAALFLGALPAAATSGAGLTYHGRLVDPSGHAVEATTVQFKIQIRTPGAENCLLYEEIHTLDMRDSGGVFAITINDGTASQVNTEPFPLDRVFQNRGTFPFDSGKCAISDTYAPNAADGRKLVVGFNDGTFDGWESLPAQLINHVPSSIESMTVGGYGKDSLLRVHDGAGLPATVPALTNTEYGALTSLIAGTSPAYLMPSSSLNGANLAAGSVDDSKLASGISAAKITGAISGNAAGFTGLLAGDVTGTQGATSVVKLRGRDIGTAVPSDGQVLTWSEGNGRWEPAAAQTGVTTETDPTVPAWIKDGIDWSEVTSKPATFAPGAHAHSFTDLQNGAGVYLDYRPNNTSCATGEILKWNDSQSRWECGADDNIPTNFGIGDLKTSLGAAQFTQASCASHQTLTWSALTDAFTCANIASLNANAITVGTIAAARLGSGSANATTYLRGDGTWIAPPAPPWMENGGDVYRVSGKVGVGTPAPDEKLDIMGNVRASGQLSTGTATINGGDSSIDWNDGNAISTDIDCASSISFANLRNGGTYTLIITGAGATKCDFSASTTGADAGTLTYRFLPANAVRTASSHTVYSLMRVGTVVYVSWASGF